MSFSFDYCLLRLVPSIEREEFFNVGVIVFCPEQRFLEAQTFVDTRKLHLFAPHMEPDQVRERLQAVLTVCAGGAKGGPIAALSQRARFHWLVAPRSTIIQPSPVHGGICDQPRPTLERLFQTQVLVEGSSLREIASDT